jgi:hypothetical protein
MLMAKEDMKMDMEQDKAMIKKAFKEHDAQEHKGGKGTKLALKKGGMTMKKMAKGGMAEGSKDEEAGESKAFEAKEDESKETIGPKNMKKDVETGSNKLTKFGESAVQKKGKTKGKNLGDSGPTKFAKGGVTRADGCAQRGKTKGRYL